MSLLMTIQGQVPGAADILLLICLRDACRDALLSTYLIEYLG